MPRGRPCPGAAAALLLGGLLGCAPAQGPGGPGPATGPPAPGGEAAPTPSGERGIALFNQGQELARRGRYAAAEPLLRQSGEANPLLHPAFLALGEVREKLGKKKEAAEAYRQALRLRPDDARAHVALARLAEEGGQPEAALYHFERASVLAPEEFLPHFRLGILRVNRGQLDAAVHNLKAAVEIDPAHRAARHWLWLSLARRGGADGWEVELGRRLVEEGDEVPIRFYQGRAAAEFREGRAEEALRTIQKAVDVNPRWRDREWRGVIEDMERYRRARR